MNINPLNTLMVIAPRLDCRNAVNELSSIVSSKNKWGKETNGDVIYQTPFYVRCLKRDGVSWTEWMPLYDAVTEGPCILLKHARSAARSLFVEKKWEISNGQVLFRKGGKAEKVIGESICHPDKCNNNQQHSLSSVLN